MSVQVLGGPKTCTECPYKFWQKIFIYLKKKVLKTVKHLANLAIILKKNLNFSRYGKKLHEISQLQ